MPSMLDLELPPIPHWRTVVAGTALFTAGFLVRGLLTHSVKPGVIRSPRTTLLPKLSKEELAKLPYPLDALPGARDVETPFGSIRVYEFGPEDGRKVLLVHGISTPCLSLGSVANALADKGCRVMLFDLPGRGYSDTATGFQQDSRFFSTHILLVLASSPLSWTGSSSGGFSLIGYSLGGGISAAFTAYFPHLVNSLVLIAPSGLLREHRFSRTSRIIYSEGVIPEPILNRIVKQRLQKPMYPPKDKLKQEGEADATSAAQAEINIEGNQGAVLSKKHPEITVEDAVVHQVINHEGFVHAFMSSIRYGPIQRQHENWQRIGRSLSERSKQSSTEEKVLIILGKDDPIIIADELQPDAKAALNGHVEFVVVNAGHEAPVTKGDEVAQHIWGFWNTNQQT